MPSTDHRTFTLDTAKVADPGALSVRAAGRRLDAAEQRPPMRSQPPPAPAPQAAGAMDPGTPGPFRTRAGEYTVDSIRLPGYPDHVEMQAIVVAPANAPGKRRLLRFPAGTEHEVDGAVTDRR